MKRILSRRSITNEMRADQGKVLHGFTDKERRGVYRAIRERRDIRSQFLPEPISDELLAGLLDAAHHAPSVGFMQPWNFIVIRDVEIRQRVQKIFECANDRAAAVYQSEQRIVYSELKLAGILEAPINLCVTCDTETPRGKGLGRQTMPETALYSAVCAVQNLWLAARSEGIGVGWVSIFDPEELRTVLEIPANVVPVAYLCLGYVGEFGDQPELETGGWERRVPLAETIYFEKYGAVNKQKAFELVGTLTNAKTLSDVTETETEIFRGDKH